MNEGADEGRALRVAGVFETGFDRRNPSSYPPCPQMLLSESMIHPPTERAEQCLQPSHQISEGAREQALFLADLCEQQSNI